MKNKEQNFISAVIYVRNAEDRIAGFLEMVMRVLEEKFEKSEIICVNDHSEDESVSVIKQMNRKSENTTVTILNMSYFHGLEISMNAGVELAIGDFVFEFDSAIQDFEEEEIWRVYQKSLEGYDIVSAVPEQKSKLSSRLFYYMFDKFSDFSYKLCTERFRILSRRVINRISSMNKAVPYRKAVYANCGLKTGNLHYIVSGVSSNGTGRKKDRKQKNYRSGLAMDTLILFTEFGYHLSVSMTVIMMLVTAFMAIYALVIYILSKPVEGWTTTILFLSFAFFGLFGVLTIIIKYLQILLDLTFRRKRYSFESIEKLTK